MKYFNRPYLLFVVMVVFMACNDAAQTKTDNGTDTTTSESTDTTDKKYNPAGEQKNSNTYNPKLIETDTLYKHRDSIPKQ